MILLFLLTLLSLQPVHAAEPGITPAKEATGPPHIPPEFWDRFKTTQVTPDLMREASEAGQRYGAEVGAEVMIELQREQAKARSDQP